MADHFVGKEVSDNYSKHRPHIYPLVLDRILENYLDINVDICKLHTIVDLGCGPGDNSELLARKCPDAQVIGIDSSESAVALASEKFKHVKNLRFQVQDVNASGLPFKDSSLDLVVAFQAAHWFDVDKLCAELERALRPGGVVALAAWRSIQLRPEGTKPHADNDDEPLNPAKVKAWTGLGDYVDDRVLNVMHTEYQAYEEALPWPENFRRVDFRNDISLREYKPMKVGQVKDMLLSYAILRRYCEAHPQEAPQMLDRIMAESLTPVGKMEDLTPDTDILALLRHFIVMTNKPL